VLVVHPSVPVKSVSEFVTWAKARPGQLNYGTAGIGSSNHLASELFNLSAGVSTGHVPYKGGSQAQVDLLGGQLTFMFDNLPAAIPHIKSGGFRALAVTSLRRQGALPDLPTMDELGYAKFEAGSWFGALAPAGTPRAVVERLNAAINSALREPALRDRYLAQGFDLNPGTPEQFAEFMQAETAKWHRVVKAAGIKGE
jgi:tripartite-type tricarboxylate transporter receptor subunit TctC